MGSGSEFVRDFVMLKLDGTGLDVPEGLAERGTEETGKSITGLG